MIYADQRWIGEHGIGRFARNVLSGLEYHPVPLTTPPASPLDPLRLAFALSKLTRHDLFFSPGYNSPLFGSARFVITIHDLNHIDRHENSSQLKRLYYASVLKRACHRASVVLTVSEFSRSRIIAWSGVSPEKVFKVSNGVDPGFHPGVIPYQPAFPYILCVGNRKGHKNEVRTVEAFAQSNIDPEIHLLFSGSPTPQLSDSIERNCVRMRVQFAGFVPSEQLPSLYRGARALVFASLYEGFGLPVLEAMACGTPVVTSNTTSLPEVAGDAALLVDPTSVDQLAAAIKRIVDDAPLSQSLREKGLRRAAQFPWSTAATAVQNLLTGLAEEGTGEHLR
jgi:glycosyltransferase involved in cell wall biosynthesis